MTARDDSIVTDDRIVAGDLPALLTLEELARFLRSSKYKMERDVQAEKKRTPEERHYPNAFKLGNTWRIPRQDVLAYVESLYGSAHSKES